MTTTKLKTIVATAALTLALVGATGGASAAAGGNNAPLEKSCVGIINSTAASSGTTPRDTADQFFGGSVRAYQEEQRTCRGGGVG